MAVHVRWPLTTGVAQGRYINVHIELCFLVTFTQSCCWQEPGASESVDLGGDGLRGHGAHESTIIADDLPIRYAKTSMSFNVSLKLRRSFVPKTSFIDLETHVMNDFVFVMAASSNHFQESVDAVASIQTLMPEKRIIYYDLGLEEKQITEVVYRL